MKTERSRLEGPGTFQRSFSSGANLINQFRSFAELLRGFVPTEARTLREVDSLDVIGSLKASEQVEDLNWREIE